MADDRDIVDASEDDDILNDLFLPAEETNEKGDILDSKALSELKDQLSDKDKQINGLIQSVKTERRNRQEYKGQLDSLTGTVNTILTQREQAEKDLAAASSKDDIITVDITEDGDAFIPKEKLNDTVAPLQDRIDLLEEQLKRTTAQNSANRESEQLIQSIVGSDDRYAPAYSKYQAARKWVNDRVIDFQQDNNIQGQLTSGQAMTHVFNDTVEKEFGAQFPGLDLAAVTTAEDSTWHFKQMLSKTAEATEPKHEPDERFRTVMNKPSGLGKSANAKGGELSLSERVGNMSATDIMNLTDDQIEALNKYLNTEEQKEGIKF